jgi:hypothetical protein
LQGTVSEVDAARSALQEVLDTALETIAGLPAGVAPMGDDLALSWTAFHAFVESWSEGRRRKPFRVKRMTGVGVVLSGGGVTARKKALSKLGLCSRPSDGRATRHLQAIKATLDPRNILGALED